MPHNHTPNACRRHRKYRLTCTEFDHMVNAVGNACTICRTPEAETKHGVLAIDHDPDLGFWAVRGILCQTCNSDLGQKMNMPERGPYLANPWHARHRTGQAPVPLPIIPTMSVDEAVELLLTAKHAIEASLSATPSERMQAKRLMKHAVRVATKSGMRQNEIVKTISRVWGREQIYYALHEDGRRVA